MFREKYRIETTRLRHWNYGCNAWYFVTICVQHRLCVFGEVVDADMKLSEMGEIAAQAWINSFDIRPYLISDVWVIMPNHVHLVFGIDPPPSQQPEYVTNRVGPLQAKSLQSAMNGYKGAVTTLCKRAGYENFAWQPRFYEHIIRDEPSLLRIRDYVLNNPAKWDNNKDPVSGIWM